MKKTFAKILAIASASLVLAFAAPAHANFIDGSYDWAYSGDGVNASGVLTVLGDASAPEAVLTFSGQRNGDIIDGLVTDPDSRFLVNNLFKMSMSLASPSVDWYGILFNVIGSAEHTNLYFDQGQYHEVSYFGTASPIDRVVSFEVTQTVPEPETFAMMLMGLGLIGFQLSKRKATVSTEMSAGQSFA